VRVSFTDWVLGGSLLSTYSSAQQKDVSRMRATAVKDRKGRSVVVLADKDVDAVAEGEKVEVMVVRKVRRKGANGSVVSVVSGGGKEGKEVKVVVEGKKVEEKVEEKAEEKAEEKKDEGKVEEKKEGDAEKGKNHKSSPYLT
jgi:predicted AAA+ superfamily ATPase